MTIRAHHAAVVVFAGTLVAAAATWMALDVPRAEAACGTGSSVIITDPGTASTAQVLSGVRNLRAYSTPVTASGMTFMLYGTTSIPLGEATQNGSDWRLEWDSRNIANGNYQLIAIARFGTATTLNCASPVVPITIHNVPTQAPTLTSTITPSSWQATVGQTSTFSVDTIYTDQYGRKSHVSPTAPNVLTWHSSIGSLGSNAGTSTVLRAGATPGQGLLMTDITYNNLTVHAQIPIKIVAAASTTTNPTATPKPSISPSPSPATSPPSTTTTATTSDSTRLATTPTIFRPETATNSKPVVGLPTLSCLEQKIGQVAFEQISSGKTRPTAEQRRLAVECFSGSQAIPAVLAPVAPTHIQEVERASNNLITVSGIKNTTITNSEGKKVAGLMVSGKGAPNTDVFIYVFSDPLVLRAQTDNQGIWSYILETPLKPGKHEVYAVAEKDAGSFVRTSAVPISIAAAAPGSQDGNLIIERQWSTAQIGFMAIAFLLVLAAGGVTVTLLRRHLRGRRYIAPATPGRVIKPKAAAASVDVAPPPVNPANVPLTPEEASTKPPASVA